MILRYFYDRALAQASYLIGCSRTGEALIIDPMRTIQPYLETAASEGLRITQVTETHIHADFVSGARELAAATGARLFLSAMGTPDWQYAYASDPGVTLVRDGDTWMIGSVRVEVLHTPGHTPEHISFMITDTAGADRPMGIFTGDFLFVGDVGRPDLLEEAAGYIGTKIAGAQQQFASVQRVKALPDYLQIWPGHGAGSACGKALGAVPSTTLGYEKLFNPAFQFDDEAAFVDWLLSGQPEPPRYFAQMKRVNKIGPALLTELADPPALDRAGILAALAAGDLVIDLRPEAAFARRHLPGTVTIPATASNFSTYVGWFVDYERPVYLIVSDETDLAFVMPALRAIGVDNVGGWAAERDLFTDEDPALSTVAPTDIVQHPQALIVDVRGATEYAEDHLPDAVNIPLGFIPRHLDQLPRDRTLLVHCASGYRSGIATSLLRRHGFTNALNIAGSYAELKAAFESASRPV
ncbi:MAG: MBL fold metallo-hydrolase [Candidatus Flexifilum sp.]